MSEVTYLHFLESLFCDYEKSTVEVNTGGMWVQLGISLVGQQVGQSVCPSVSYPMTRDPLFVFATMLLADLGFKRGIKSDGRWECRNQIASSSLGTNSESLGSPVL